MKYGNKKITINGQRFDSKLEASHYFRLVNLQKQGRIKYLARQVTISLSDKPKGRNVRYIADFVFLDLEKNIWVVMDSKGYATRDYKVKRDWLLDKFKGFIFIENSKNGEVTFNPYGTKDIFFKIV